MSRRVSIFGSSFISLPQIVSNGLVLYLDAGNSLSYSGTGTQWNDLSPSNNNGTLINGPTFNGGVGGNIVFDGVNDLWENTTFPNVADFSLSTWAYFNINTGETYHSMVSRGSVFSNNSAFAFGLRRNVFTGTVNVFLYSRLILTFGMEFDLGVNTHQQWRYYSVTKDGNNYSFYMNGILITTYVRTQTIPTSIFPLRVGGPAATPSTDRFFPGSIAQVHLYNRGLTDVEVLQNFNATKSRYGY